MSSIDPDEERFELETIWTTALVNLYRGHPYEFCERLREYDFPLPAKIRDFIAGVLAGTVKAPPARRKRSTLDFWEHQAIRIAAISHHKRQQRGDSRADLIRERKAAIGDLATRYGRTWDTVEKHFKHALAQLRRERTG
ncbi:hypothetical protein [Ottowia sp. SB7-C50]|uniref:hypothetical protein n=1 Tax=Ottowia sp. SB7-C50 TaxID=3081231 RepID=UPI0029557106|nr:hypothetical protein [Ottowia sp. SB7-C50]WOP15937.1 hypothetical protein R0D99_02400 [Ottowia sp. SB7-C50]